MIDPFYVVLLLLAISNTLVVWSAIEIRASAREHLRLRARIRELEDELARTKESGPYR